MNLLRIIKTLHLKQHLQLKVIRIEYCLLKQGYHVILVYYYWLQDSELAIERVKQRVKEGGHNIEPEIIKRRYLNGIKNFFNIYFSIVDEILLFDNSDNKSDFITEKKNNSKELTVYKIDKVQLFKKYYNES